MLPILVDKSSQIENWIFLPTIRLALFAVHQSWIKSCKFLRALNFRRKSVVKLIICFTTKETDVRVKNSILHFNPTPQPTIRTYYCVPTLTLSRHNTENTAITTIAMPPTPPCHRPDCCRKFVINNPLLSGAHPLLGWDFPGEGSWEVLALSLSDCHTSRPMYLSMIEMIEICHYLTSAPPLPTPHQSLHCWEPKLRRFKICNECWAAGGENIL